MNTQTTVALISGSVALLVALIGIAGAIAAQFVATRRAFENSLALFERQRAAEERNRREETKRQDTYRYAEERRVCYARFLQIVDEYAKVQTRTEKHQRDWRSSGLADDSDATAGAAKEHFAQQLGELYKQIETATEQLGYLAAEMQLIGSNEVLEAAQRFAGAAQAVGIGGEEYLQTRDAYRSAVRRDLGIDMPQQ